MALYGKIRDIRLFQSLNKELLNNIIDTKVDIFRFNLEETNSNVYGESDNKVYKQPIRVNCLIQVDEQSSNYDEVGYNIEQTFRFAFLRDELIKLNLIFEAGDLVHWNNNFYELDHKIENQLFMKRNPNTNKDLGNLYGWNISVIFTGHMTERNKLNIENTITR